MALLFIILLSVSCVQQKQDVAEVAPGTRGSIVVDSGGTSFDFGEVVLGHTVTQTITLRHEGDLPVTKMSSVKFAVDSPFQFKDGDYPGAGGDCGDTLKDQETCKVVISFTPESEQDWNDNVLLNFVDGIDHTSAQISLYGYGGNVANVIASSTNFDLSVNEPNSIIEQVITFTNTGGLSAINFGASFTVTNPYNFKGGAFPGVGGTCTNIIKKGTSCTIVTQYNPTLVGVHSGQLNITYKNPLNSKSITIDYSAICASIEAELVFMGGSSYDYKTLPVGAAKDYVFVVQNQGFRRAENIQFIANAPFYVLSNDCPPELAIAATCNVNVRYNPSASGTQTEDLSVQYYSGKSTRTYSMSLTGKANPPGHIGFSKTSPWDVGQISVNANAQVQVSIFNDGSYKATNITYTLPNGMTSPFTLVSSSCPASMTPGYICDVILNLNPAVQGIFTDQIVVNYNNGVSDVSATLDITVDARPNAILKFQVIAEWYAGNVVTNTTATKMAIVENVGIGMATSITPSILFTGFNFLGGSYPGTGGTCGTDLAPAATCSIFFEASSPTQGVVFQNYQIAYFDGDSIKSLDYYLNVTFVGPGNLDLYAPSTTSIATNPVVVYPPGQAADTVFRFRNTGAGTNVYPVDIISVTLDDTTNFAKTINAGAPPTPDCVGYALSKSTTATPITCDVTFNFHPATYGTKNVVMTVVFFDGVVTQTKTYNFFAEATDVAVIDQPYFAPGMGLDIGNVAVGGNGTKIYNIYNAGTGPATSLTLNPPGSPFAIQSTTCGATLNPSSSCQVVTEFNPTAAGTYVSTPDFTFTFFDGVQNQTIYIPLMGNGTTAANLKYTAAGNSHDFGLTVVNNAKPYTVTVLNIGGSDATSVTISNPLTSYYTISSNTCASTIAGGSGSCTFVVTYTPTVAGQIDNDSIDLTYFNGLITKTITLSLTGQGEPHLPIHKGWDEIYAIGDKVNTGNFSSGDQLVRLKWPAFLPTGPDPITGYNVYRTTVQGTYNFSTPIASDVPINNRVYTDTSITPGTTYWYTIKAIILGVPARTTEVFTEVKVIAPPSNMALVHRWIANQYVCNQIGSPIDKTNNFRCIYSGPGNTGGKFDLGYDLLVDRFEIGADGTSRSNQYPLQLNQAMAYNQCQNTVNNTTISGVVKQKRLLTRKEYMIASSWPSTMTSTQIDDTENGLQGAGKCNGIGTSFTLSGSNSSCRSQFGAEDMVGNSWEWVSDRMVNGVGPTNPAAKIDVTNTDLDGVDVSQVTTGYADTKECFNYALGIYANKSGGVCPTNYVTTATLPPSTSEYLRQDYIYEASSSSGVRMLAVGGSYMSYPGRFTLGWLPNITGGFRCGVAY